MRPYDPIISELLDAVNAAHTVHVSGFNSAFVQCATAPSANAVQIIFEGRVRDGAPWVTLACRASNATAAATLLAQPAALSAVPVFGWFVNLAGISSFRIRVVSKTAGGVTVSVGLSDQPVL
jgi:hypothetical protein